MSTRLFPWMAALALGAVCLFAQEHFVTVSAGEMPGRPDLVFDSFEIADTPVTNADYHAFVQETGHRAPSHWESGRPPAGFDNHPVIYVNRYDAEKYLAWRSRKESRLYRLPTSAEFEYAARGGQPGALYPWGNDDPIGKANFDAAGDRQFPHWRLHLKPVRSYAPNARKLYDMAGNVWQMVNNQPDPAQQRWIYRLEHPKQKESSVAGGSWARSMGYLRVTLRGGAGGAGITHPDLGFRIVREVPGSTHSQRNPRRLAALRKGAEEVAISWQLLPADDEATAFHVYRSPRRDASGKRLTSAPVKQTTFWRDTAAPQGFAYYRVRPVGSDGREGAPSEWVTASPAPSAGNVAASIAPSPKLGNCSPVFGDLTGDGLLDVVFRCDNGIKENTRDPGHWVELEAFTSYGKQLWRKRLVDYDHCYGNANNSPFLVADLDGDGRAEVAARMQLGDDVFLAILNGVNGNLLRKTPWPAMATDVAGTSTRIHMAVAYLDGVHPALVTQTGLYENERFHAFDKDLEMLWHFDSFGPTSGSGSHHVDIADLDGDGKDEVLDGTTALNGDGTVRWSLYRLHPDIVAVKRILPAQPGDRTRQIYFAVESNTHAGAYLVDASTGKLIWKHNRETDPTWSHAHVGWAADILATSPGMEMMTNKDGHEAQQTVLISAVGEVLMEGFPSRFRPVNWMGSDVRELIAPDSTAVHRFEAMRLQPIAGAAPSATPCRFVMSADLLGDYRDEVVCATRNDDGSEVFHILTNGAMPEGRQLTRTASREYRLWLARNIGAGYASYFEWQEGH
ncbi:MAG: SUMF1/EgtB/PvdO family nonheme iron enzyme [Bryobacterales bacterium]|nr:SUMF1/EgtB/PvdO family nonheme iron enzyme [Bryobacterales bacterium]